MSAFVRFLHASDFHLDQPPHGLIEIPEHLRSLLLDAPFTAARRVFDAAIKEHVDFVLLCGDLLDVHLAGPRGIAFLLEQFERLNAESIAVYWAAGQTDNPQHWPTTVKLPANVQVFTTFKSEEVSHFRGETALANLVGRSFGGTLAIQPADFTGDHSNVPCIAITYGKADVERLTSRAIDYWALGSRHERQSFSVRKLGGEDAAEWHASGLAHYPGSPQGRGIDEPGPHGCTLVHISQEQTVRTQFIPTDAVRWHDERLSIEAEETKFDAKRRIQERMQELRAEAGEKRPLIVLWTLSGGEHLGSRQQRRQWCGELLAWLRTDFGRGDSAAWTLNVALDDSAPLSKSWEEEDSMLGDFLRVLTQQAASGTAPLDVSCYLPERWESQQQHALAGWHTGEVKEEVLHEAARLGAALLGADERTTAR
jgi:DNA repair exonuclease SbcCD nuclease subunit